MSIQRGQFQVHCITLANPEGETVDIASQVGQIDLYENIFETFITGTLRVFDGLNILERFRLFGQEYIHLNISQYEGTGEEAAKTFTINKNLRIYKISQVEKVSSTLYTYLIHLVDPRMFFTRKARISTTYRGSISDIIANLCIDKAHISKEEFDLFEESKPDNLQVVVPNLTVHETVSKLTSEALTMDSGASWANPFFFYQTVNGGFRFCSIDTMMQQEYPIEFTYNIARQNKVEESTLEDKESGKNSQILAVTTPKRFDVAEGMATGAYAGRKNSYDQITQISSDVIFDLSEVYARNPKGHHSGYVQLRIDDEFEKIIEGGEVVDEDTPPDYREVDFDTNLNKSFDAYYKNSIDMNHKFGVNEDYASSDTFRDIDFNHGSAESFERNALEKMLHQNMTRISIPGRTDIQCGLMLHAEIPLTQVDDNKVENPFDDSKFLITGIKYEFKVASKESFCHLECVKESIAAKIEDAEIAVSDAYRSD